MRRGGVHKDGPTSTVEGGGGQEGGMKEEEFDGFLILVRNQTWLLEAALTVRDQPTSCTLPARPPFGLWLHQR